MPWPKALMIRLGAGQRGHVARELLDEIQGGIGELASDRPEHR